MLRMGGGFEVVDDSDAGELEVFAFLIAPQLLGGFGRRCGFFLLGFQQVNLRFYVFAFPSSGHIDILTQKVPQENIFRYGRFKKLM